MADDRPEDTDLSTDFGRPRRPPPTIELEASEVNDKPVIDPSAEPAVETKRASEAAATGQAGAEEAGADAKKAARSNDADPTASAAGPKRGKKTPWVAVVLMSALSGAAAAGLVVAALVWLLGWPIAAIPPAPVIAAAPVVVPQLDHTAIDALAARVADLESKTAAPPASTPPSPAAEPAAASADLDALEKSLASQRQELAGLQSQSQQLSAAVTELKAASHEAPPPPDLSGVNEKLAQIGRTTQAQIAALAQQNAKPADDKPLRRVVAATLLDVSVRHGEPYAAALDAAKALAPDPATLKPLEPFASSGLPGPAALSRNLLALLPKPEPAAQSATTTTGTSIIDRLQAGAARLVRIQRTDAGDSANSGGGDRTAVIMRAAAAAQRNDIAGARRELNDLPGADRAAVSPGIDQLDAHEAALAASRQFAADALAAFSKPAP